MQSIASSNYLVINEFGQLLLGENGQTLVSQEVAQELLKNLQLNDSFTLVTHFEETQYLVEAFDHPLLAQKIYLKDSKLFILSQYDLEFECLADKLSLDEDDRICGLTTSQAPFRLTEKAQDLLFNECDEFDDESFTLKQVRFETPAYFIENLPIEKNEFWTQVYSQSEKPGWDLQAPSPAFVDMLPRLKLPKCRILVLGCGTGHDAALFAQAGHVVTAIDFSESALLQARKNYGHLENLTFENHDLFKLPHEWNESFDVIIEHTCYCAIPPHKRKDLVKVWKRLLHDEGQLIAVFFTMLKRSGPPYGASEFEIRENLKKHFQFLFWGRWKKSVAQRLGRELFVFAKKKTA